MGLRPYAVWSPAYAHYCGGIRALYRLVEELHARNVPAHIGDPITGEEIVVYPEIIDSNPFNAPRVVRWKLNQATLPNDGMTFAWAKNMGHPVLTVDIIEPHLFYPRTGPRKGVAFWVHKGQADPLVIPPGAVQITHGWPARREELADLLGSVEYLLSFDPFTAMVPEALLCGTPVLIHAPRSTWTREQIESHGWIKHGVAWQPAELPIAKAHVHLAVDHYQHLRREFAASIDHFIRQTQAEWPMEAP